MVRPEGSLRGLCGAGEVVQRTVWTSVEHGMRHFCAGFHVVREGGWRPLVFFCVGVFVERVGGEKGRGGG